MVTFIIDPYAVATDGLHLIIIHAAIVQTYEQPEQIVVITELHMYGHFCVL